MYHYSPFRDNYTKEKPNEACVFCDEKQMQKQAIFYPDGTVVENKHYRWIVNAFPKFEGHTLLIPKRHIEDLGFETKEELADKEELIRIATCALRELYKGAGIEFFAQIGEASARSRRHLHFHIVPAQPDDPLRSFEKLGHYYTTKPNEEKVVIFPIEIKLAKEKLQDALRRALKNCPR